jgi:hypothetical protein
MWTPERDMGVLALAPVRYALGWIVSESGGHEVLSHLGGVSGFEASFARIPDARLTVVVLSNLSGSQLVVRRIAQAAEEVVLTGKASEPVEERALGVFDDSELKGLVGDYAMDAASSAAMKNKLPKDVISGHRGLTLSLERGHLYISFVGRPRAEVFRGVDGVLFTKHTALELVVGAADADLVPAVVVSSAKNAGALNARYVRLDTVLGAAPDAGACPVGTVRLPGGTLSTHTEVTVAPFCMDLTEVTVGAYAACVRTGACVSAPTRAEWKGISEAERARWSSACNGGLGDRQNHPINCVDWAQAVAYCRAQRKRLPTAVEWEWAARAGEQARTFPWGYRTPGPQLCWSGIEVRHGTCAVGSFPESDARGGIHDLAGNVWEWTSTATRAAGRVQKGGGWNAQAAADLEAERQLDGDLTFRGPNVGFRCAK